MFPPSGGMREATNLLILKGLGLVLTVYPVTGFRGPSQGALHRPEGPSLLYWPREIHALRTSGCYGECVRVGC